MGCLSTFPEIPKGKGKGKAGENGTADGAVEPKGMSESGRYACTVCGTHFCIDCDVMAHEVLHNCPGCQSDTRGSVQAETTEHGNGDAMEE